MQMNNKISGNDIRLLYSTMRALSSSATAITMLHIGPEQTVIAAGSGFAPSATLQLTIGSRKTARDCFHRMPPTPLELENAIAVVEDEVSRARTMVASDSILFTSGPLAREIAMIAGIGNGAKMALSLEALEQTFDRLTSVSLGKSAATAGLPTSAEFAATLLILREFMHHLQFSSITII